MVDQDLALAFWGGQECHLGSLVAGGRGDGKAGYEALISYWDGQGRSELLAVDMMNHAFRRNMSLAMLVSGDQDFKPLVQSMVDMGLHVHVLGDHRHTSPDLAAAADLYRPLTIRDYLEWSPESFRTAFPVPGKHISNPGLETYKKLKDVTIGGQLGELFHDGTTYLARYPAEGLFMVLTSHDEQRLRLYCEMDFGQVVW